MGKGRPFEPGALTNAEHQMPYRQRQKDELAALRTIVAAVMQVDPEAREFFVERGYSEVIKRAEEAVPINLTLDR